jgi:hypothetical protein
LASQGLEPVPDLSAFQTPDMMTIADLAAEGRAIAAELRPTNGALAKALDRLMTDLVNSLDARLAETKQGHAMRPSFESGVVVIGNRRVTAANLFRKTA